MLKEYNSDFLLTPCPTVLVTSRFNNFDNVVTISWTGIACSHPEYVTISINPKRYSFEMIKKTKKFCINIPSIDLLDKVDYCGSFSGNDVDKFKECNFNKTIIDDYVLIEECRFFILCDVEYVINLGSHYLFIAKVIKKFIRCEEKYDESIEIQDILNPIIYYRPYYYKLDMEKKGVYGYTKKNVK
ncbi:MAG: flavin reductase family protein [Bacilli bacterium]|nr:flavin reductase family protein [Bacilli bacterium]